MPRTANTLQLKNELAVQELIKNFRHDGSWLQEVTPKPKWVNQDVIKIPKRGLAPRVLVNNKIYPIQSNKREDSHVVISLNMYDTENTTVTAEELHTIPYDKLGDVQQQHREELEDKTAEHALYSIAPDDAPQTPVLVTTGEVDETGRKRLTAKDLIRTKKALDKLLVPKEGRVLVLCSDHVADLMVEDMAFKVKYQDAIAGKIAKNYYGFELYEATHTPKYDAVTKEKLPFESVSQGVEASVIFHKKYTVKAPGSAARFARMAADDPENRENTIGFRIHFVCVSIKDEGSAAIISG